MLTRKSKSLYRASHDRQYRVDGVDVAHVGFPSEVLGLVADSVAKILRILSATKPRTSDGKPRHRRRKETKQQPGTAGPGNIRFLCDILCPQAVQSRWSGCRRGKEKKLSSSQEQLGQATYSAVTKFLSVS